MNYHFNHPIVILIRGLPGSGKTYLARELKKILGNEVVMLDPDATDYTSQEYLRHTQALTGEGVDQRLHAYRFLRGQAYKGIADHSVIIWNQPFTNLEIFHKMVANLKLQADQHKTKLSLLVVEVQADPKLAKARVEKRKQEGGHGPSDEAFERFVNDYKTFANEGYTTITVSGEDDKQESAAKVLAALRMLAA